MLWNLKWNKNEAAKITRHSLRFAEAQRPIITRMESPVHRTYKCIDRRSCGEVFSSLKSAGQVKDLAIKCFLGNKL